MWEKEKLLVTNNFSFSHNVFYSSIFLVHHNVALCGNGLRIIRIEGIWSKQNNCENKSFTLSWEWKKTWAKEKMHFPQFSCFFFWRRVTSIFSYSHNAFQKASLMRCSAWVAQWWACLTDDLVVVSLIPSWGDFSFRRIFATHLCRSMWEK